MLFASKNLRVKCKPAQGASFTEDYPRTDAFRWERRQLRMEAWWNGSHGC